MAHQQSVALCAGLSYGACGASGMAVEVGSCGAECVYATDKGSGFKQRCGGPSSGILHEMLQLIRDGVLQFHPSRLESHSLLANGDCVRCGRDEDVQGDRGVEEVGVVGASCESGDQGLSCGYGESSAKNNLHVPKVGKAEPIKELTRDFVVNAVDSDVGSDESSVVKRGKNYAKNLAKRLKRKSGKKVSLNGTTVKSDRMPNAEGNVVDKDRSELQRSFDVRRIAENKLAAQKAEFQLKRNEYMTKSRVSELEWETRRLQTDQKLAKITEARLGSKPGFAETLIENNISSTSLPSLSKGTISPDSSISVDEVRKMEKLIETLSGQVQSLTTQLNGLQESIKANQRFGGKFDLDENDKIIMPRFKTPDERLEWMANLSDEEMEALGPDYHRDGRKVEDGSRLSFDGYTEDYSLQDEAMKEAGITMIG